MFSSLVSVDQLSKGAAYIAKEDITNKNLDYNL